jgi:hypothetical protein
LFGVCLFFWGFWPLRNVGLPPQKKNIGGKTWAGPPSTVPIVGQDDAVGNLVRAAIVNSRRPHEPKVHEVFATTFREAFSRLPGRLLPDVGLLLEVDVPERVIFENGRKAVNVFR